MRSLRFRPLLRAVLPAFALCAASLPGFRPAAAKESLYRINIDQPVPEWREGPVRYIISMHEDKAYKALKTMDERTHFIDIFWQRRDPTPKTDYNEFKERFRNRALDANHLYGNTATPGWKTDMGKVYIMVGPPDEMIRDQVPRGKRGTVMWVYRQPPFPDLPPNTVIAFAQDVSGEYLLSTQPTWDSDVAHGIQFMGPKATDPEFNYPMFGKDPLLLSAGVPYSQGEFETNFIYGRMQQLPPKDEAILHDVVTARTSFDVFPFKSRYSYFRTGTGTTLLAVTLGIKTTSVQYRNINGKDSPDLEVLGKFVDLDHPENQVAISTGDLFAAAPQNANAGIDDTLLYQALVPLKPGRYMAVFAAKDNVASKVGTYRDQIIVPDFTDPEKLAMSTITVAEELGPYTATGETKVTPFKFGTLEVVQADDSEVKTKDSLNVYYQIYNAKKDDTGAANLEIDYDYFAMRAGSEKPLGNIHIGPTSSQSQAYSLPLERFPAGNYRLRVTATDREQGLKVSQSVDFTVVP